MTAQAAASRPDESWLDAPLGAPPLAHRQTVVDVPATQAKAAEPSRDGGVDYESALAYVRQIGNAMRAADAQIRAREETAEELTRHSHDQIRRAEEALRLAEERGREAAFQIRAAELRATRAEARAKEAEAWLNRLFDTMQQELQAVQTGLIEDKRPDETPPER